MRKIDSLKNLVVVYIENDLNIQAKIGKYLKTLFETPHIYADTMTALKQAKKLKPDILITNLNHERLHGMDFIRAAKQLNPQTEVIITSSSLNKENIMSAMRMDVIDCIEKPFEFNVLDAALIKAENKLSQKKEFIELKRKSIQDEIEHSDNTNIYKVFEMLQRDNIPIDIINFYKGVPIINTGFIKEVKNNSIFLQTQSLQKLVMSLETFINIESSVLPKPIKLDVSHMNSYSEPVKLGNPKIKNFSLRRRKDVRLIPDDNFKLSITTQGQTINVKVDDISSQLITFSVINIEDKDLFDDGNTVDTLLNFTLDKHGEMKIRFTSEISVIRRQKDTLIYAIKPLLQGEEEEDLHQYILQREFQIINELKNLRLINGI